MTRRKTNHGLLSSLLGLCLISMAAADYPAADFSKGLGAPPS